MRSTTALFVLRPSVLGQRSNGDPVLPVDHVGHRCLDGHRHWRSGDEEEVGALLLYDTFTKHKAGVRG